MLGNKKNAVRDLLRAVKLFESVGNISKADEARNILKEIQGNHNSNK